MVGWDAVAELNKTRLAHPQSFDLVFFPPAQGARFAGGKWLFPLTSVNREKGEEEEEIEEGGRLRGRCTTALVRRFIIILQWYKAIAT